MSVVVLKFGGTSLASAQKIQLAASRAIHAKKAGNQVVLVVSARGKTTDELVSLANEINPSPPDREMDMLLSTGEQVSVALMAMALHAAGHTAISLTGSQIGIITDRSHTKARIREIATVRVRQALEEGHIVVAAGFQGIDPDSNITTLGRGGSDTTAVAIAAVLDAKYCAILTDVEGVFTADPRVTREACKIPFVGYDEMLELASLGAGVMHSRSIEFAKKFNVPIHVSDSSTLEKGTWILSTPLNEASPAVRGLALVRDEARVTLLGVPNRPGAGKGLFSLVAEKNIPIDMIIQNVGADGKTEVSFTVLRSDLQQALSAATEAIDKGLAEQVTHDARVSKISIVGEGMRNQSGVASQMFSALSDQNINILMITTSEIKVSVLVNRSDSAQAVNAVHRAFSLETTQSDKRNINQPEANHILSDSLEDRSILPEFAGNQTWTDDRIMAQLSAGMEELVVTEITLDEEQSRITLEGVQDQPGMAARIFKAIASADVLVDMIVQNISLDGVTHLSFTVPRDQIDHALQIAGEAANQVQARGLRAEPEIAKLSVLGIGMRSHTDVASRMFAALAKNDINVELINTSEVRVSVLVQRNNADRALQALRSTFQIPK
ncbi:MAG: aspartate kinase [Planctomycetes bacterium]|nr:aspartate kinase [Planctomycetota bacterium]